MYELIQVPTYGLNLGRGYWYPRTSNNILIFVGDALRSKSPGAGLGPAPGNSGFLAGAGILKKNYPNWLLWRPFGTGG